MYYFVVNPVSGCGRGKNIWKGLRKALDRRGVCYESFVLRHPGEAREIAARLCTLRRPLTLIVVGGDGTINEVVSGLSACAHITFGCIPTGSGNDFVRGLGLAKEPSAALDAILHPQTIRSIKLGTIRGDGFARSFAVSCGIGFDAAVCSEVNRSRVKDLLNWFRLGKLVYTGIALRQLAASRFSAMTLVLDDGRSLSYDRVFFAAVMNMAYEGGGFRFAPDQRPEDDTFTLCIAEGISRLRVLSLLPLALFGRHVGRRGVHLIPCRSVTLQADDSHFVHTDGETPGTSRTLTVQAHTDLLRVITR